MWYCKVRFISGIVEDVVFSDKYNAEIFYNSVGKEQFIKDYDRKLINLNNVETITKPEEFKA